MLQGRARFEFDGETVDAGAGTFVYAPPEPKRTAFAEEAGTTIVAIGGGAPGQPYLVQGWELVGPMMKLFRAGEHAQAADWATERLASGELPESAALVYNLACAESLSGRPEAALAHLGRAIELDEHFRGLAFEDSDFDAVRETPEFGALMSGSG